MENTSINNFLKSLEGLYLDGKFSQAQSLLLEHKDILLPSVFHYNLGTIYLKQEMWPAARYHLEKAWALGKLDSKTLHNLEIVKQKLAVRDLQHSSDVRDHVIYYGQQVPANLIISFFLLVSCIFLYLYYRRTIRQVWVLGCGLLLALLPLVGSEWYRKHWQSAIVLETTGVREGPSGIYPASGEIAAGVQLVVGKSYNGWSLIEAPVFYVGWIKDGTLGKY